MLGKYTTNWASSPAKGRDWQIAANEHADHVEMEA